MTKQELEELIDRLGKNIPDRLSGNEQNEILANRLKDIVKMQRATVVALFRDWISFRLLEKGRTPESETNEGRLWFALKMAQKYALEDLTLRT